MNFKKSLINDKKRLINNFKRVVKGCEAFPDTLIFNGLEEGFRVSGKASHVN
jgi:hypothetical protein